MKADPNCRLCKLSDNATKVCVLGRGERGSEVMVLTEQPGDYSHHLLQPFLDSTEAFIASAIACEVPATTKLSKTAVKACSKWVKYQVNRVAPRYVLLLGNVPLQSVTGEVGISRKRGKPFEQDGIIYLPTWHPKYVDYDERQLPTFQADLNLFADIIAFGGIPEVKELDFRIVYTQDDFDALIDDLEGEVAIDLETTCLYPWDGDIISIQFGTAERQWILPLHGAGVIPIKRLNRWLDVLADKLADTFNIFHNGKFDALWLRVKYGMKVRIDFDTMLADYILDENRRHGLKELAQRFFAAPDWDVDLKTKTTWSERNAKYAAHDVYYTRRLKVEIYDRDLAKDKQVALVFQHVLMPCANLFVEVEYDGIYIDMGKMHEAEKYLREQLAEAKTQLDAMAPGVNWGSPVQVAKFFFETLGLDPLDKTGTGKASTSESVLLRLDHPAAALLLKYRAADKQLATFIEGWKPFIVDSYIHPTFKLHGTVTGRLSCEHPNLQQVPRDKRIRTLITAPPGWTLVEVDLSQIELRVAAEMSRDPTLMAAYTNGEDVHWLTALREIARGGGMADLVTKTAKAHTGKKHSYAEAIDILLKMGPDTAADLFEEWKELRKKAKATNFGYLFGMWWKKFKLYARDNYGVHLTDQQARESRIAFFDLYSELEDWHKRQRRFAMMNGFVRSLSGRKRRLPAALSSRDTPERAEALRQAINSPVQSFANEINLMGAIQLRQEYGRNIVRLCGTVHDACLLRVRDPWVEEVTLRLQEILRKPKLFEPLGIELSVPIEADAKVGPWGAGISLDKWVKSKSHSPE
jgi:DNA polymerase-1